MQAVQYIFLVPTYLEEKKTWQVEFQQAAQQRLQVQVREGRRPLGAQRAREDFLEEEDHASVTGSSSRSSPRESSGRRLPPTHSIAAHA